MKKVSLVLLGLALLAVLLLAAQAPPAEPGAAVPAAAVKPSAGLLDRGASNRGGPGGGPPTTIALPGAGPSAVPAPPGFGFLAGGFFPPAGFGAFLGNLFVPGSGYPPTFLTSGATSGFDVTGAFAWHLAPSPMASVVRILGAVVVPPPPATATPLAPVGPVVAGLSAAVSIGTPAPSAVVGGPGVFSPPLPVTPVSSGIFCGLAVGWAGGPISAGPVGNGLGGVSGVAAPPLRFVTFPPTGGAIRAVPAPPGAYIAGCYADSSTTPVELMTFSVE